MSKFLTYNYIQLANLYYYIFYRYYHNRLHAQQNANTCMSIIIDGMDQSHSKIPYLGSAVSLKEALTMHVVGVLEHGSKGIL